MAGYEGVVDIQKYQKPEMLGDMRSAERSIRARTRLFCIVSFGLILVLPTSGCFSTMKSVNEYLFGQEHTVDQINARVKKFHQALYWGDVDEALAFVAPRKRNNFRSKARERKETERLVEMEVTSVDVDEASDAATVDVVIEYFVIPHYQVQKRTELQIWEFDAFSGEWMYREASEMKTL